MLAGAWTWLRRGYNSAAATSMNGGAPAGRLP